MTTSLCATDGQSSCIFCHHIYVYFSLHAKLIQSGRRDEKKKIQWIMRLFLQGNGDGGSRGAPLLPVAFYLALFFPNTFYSHSLSCPPPLIRIHHYISYERKRLGFLRLLLQRDGDKGLREAPRIRVVLVFVPLLPLVWFLPLLLPLLPPSPLPGCVYCCVVALMG